MPKTKVIAAALPVVSEDDGPEVVDSLNADGMLSPVMDNWRLHYLSDYDPWFTFCRNLNQLAMKVWVEHWRKGEGGSSKALLPMAARVFGRGMNAHVSAILLCERGLSVEAAGLARSISEASFWLAYMAKDGDKALSDLEADDLKNWIARERELQRVWPNDIKIVAQSKANEAELVASLGGRSPKRIDNIAKTYGRANGYLKYRIMSGFYGHLSKASLRHNFKVTSEKTGLNILGPHPAEIPSALYFAADSLIDCGEPYARIVEDADAVSAFRNARVALDKLRAEHMPERKPD